MFVGTRGKGKGMGLAYGVRRAFWAIHYDIPVVYIGFVHEADFDSGWKQVILGVEMRTYGKKEMLSCE